MVGSLLSSLIGIGERDDIDFDELTESDLVAELVSEIREFASTAAKVLIDEQDAYLAGNVLQAAENGNKTVVVVIGAGHKTGATNYLKNPGNIPPLILSWKSQRKVVALVKLSALFLLADSRIFCTIAPLWCFPEAFFDSFCMLVHYHRNPQCTRCYACGRPS